MEAFQSTAQKERCVYICDYRFDLSPYAKPFGTQTKGGNLQILWRFVTYFLVRFSTPVEVTCHLGGHVSHWE